MGSMGKRHRTSCAGFSRALGNQTGAWCASRRGSPFKQLLLVLALSACTNSPTGIQGRWVGSVKPVAGNCDSATQALLTIEAGRTPPYAAIFSPTAGVLTLHGTSDGISQVAADLHATGMNHQPSVLAFSGTRTGDTITGTYLTQRCRAEVELHRG
jgi:hypothetical protein